jgi:hypothetical protein
MAKMAVAALESALRARKLDRTLTTALPSLDHTDPSAALPTGIAPLDAVLRGGLPRGQLSEIAGPPSSGRTTVLLQVVGAATRRGEIAALVDANDRLDVASAAAAGVDLGRLLWIRGGAGGPAGGGVGVHAAIERGLAQALKALMLVLQAGGFGVVALDLADVPAAALRRLPFTTWLRVQRAVEGRDTACVLVGPEPIARSAGGLTLALEARAGWRGAGDHRRYLERMDVAARIVSPRRRVEGTVVVEALAV